MDSAIRQTVLQSYLSQQLQYSGGGSIIATDVPTPAVLEEFKTQVRTWIDLDNTIKKLQQALRERRDLKKRLTEKLVAFMARYNIEDLNTREGKLRFKVALVKPSLSQKAIQERMVKLFSEAQSGEDLSRRIFQDERPAIERASLRRIQVKTIAPALTQ